MKQLWLTKGNKKIRIDSISALRELWKHQESTDVLCKEILDSYCSGVLTDWIYHQPEYTNDIGNQATHALLHAITDIERCNLKNLKEDVQKKLNTLTEDKAKQEKEEEAINAVLEELLESPSGKINLKKLRNKLKYALLCELLADTGHIKLLAELVIKNRTDKSADTPITESKTPAKKRLSACISIMATAQNSIDEDEAEAKEKMKRLSREGEDTPLKANPQAYRLTATTPGELDIIIKERLDAPNKTVHLENTGKVKRFGYSIKLDEIHCAVNFKGKDNPHVFIFSERKNQSETEEEIKEKGITFEGVEVEYY